LGTIGQVADAIAITVHVTSIVQDLVGHIRVEGVILEAVVVENAQAVGNEGEAGRAEAEENNINDLLFIGGVGQG
jgi:hypothetical protein